MAKNILILFALIVLSPIRGIAGEADIVDVKIAETGDGIFRFDVSVLHQDAGWDHYADKWDIVGPNGAALGTRTLLHPHVGEHPFTRSLGSVEIPNSISQVTLRAHDLVHGYGGIEMVVDLPR